jgi:Uma2 family endonuclease
LIGVIADAMNLEAEGLGASTFTREDLERGFEADSCFYVQNVDKIRNKERVDLSTDPPPDLVVEIDITNPSINKLVLFKEFGVPEVWRYDGQRLEILRLQGNSYKASEGSIAFPGVSATAVTRLLREGRSLGRTGWLRMTRVWAHERSERPEDPITG